MFPRQLLGGVVAQVIMTSLQVKPRVLLNVGQARSMMNGDRKEEEILIIREGLSPLGEGRIKSFFKPIPFLGPEGLETLFDDQ